MITHRDRLREDAKICILRVVHANAEITERAPEEKNDFRAGGICYILNAPVEKVSQKPAEFADAANKRRYAHVLSLNAIAATNNLLCSFIERNLAECEDLKTKIKKNDKVYAIGKLTVIETRSMRRFIQNTLHK